MLVKPNSIGVKVFATIVYSCAFGEKQQVGFNGGVRGKYTFGQTDDGVQFALLQQQFFKRAFYTIAK